jgi:hypothetical protein
MAMGDGDTKVAKFEGHWQTQITAQGLENSSEGILFDIQDFPPAFSIPPSINLATPGPQIVPRFWSAVIEAVLYVDKEEAEKAGKSAVEMINSLLTDELRGSLLYTPTKSSSSAQISGKTGANASSKGKKGAHEVEKQKKYEDVGAELAAQDGRPLPPAIRFQRAIGRHLTYQLQYVVQSLTQAALEKESEEMEAVVKSDVGGGGGKMVVAKGAR